MQVVQYYIASRQFLNRVGQRMFKLKVLGWHLIAAQCNAGGPAHSSFSLPLLHALADQLRNGCPIMNLRSCHP